VAEPREGAALLQGLVRCGRCGRKMQVAYSGTSGKVRRYTCVRGRDWHATGRACQTVGGARLDKTVTGAFLEAAAPAGIAWGEEPKYHIDLPKGGGTSFTQSRTEMIKEFIEQHDVVASADVLLEQMNEHFASRRVDPFYPASHLRAPEPQQEEEPPDDHGPQAPRDEAQDQGPPEVIDELDPDGGA
jgi:hypothetical protein